MDHHTIALLRVMRGSFFVKTPDHFLPHMEDLGRRVSDPDDDLKYFKWKRRAGIFMRGQNFKLKLFVSCCNSDKSADIRGEQD